MISSFDLLDPIIGKAAKKPNVCIVSNEIVGPFKNGGIGTSMTGLAEALARDGFTVTILYTGDVWGIAADLTRWKNAYKGINIEIESFSPDDLVSIDGPVSAAGFGLPHLVYRYLRRRHFDVVHFNDTLGEGYCCLAAKKLKLAFAGTLFFVAVHSPSQWILELNEQLPSNILHAAYNYAERLSIRSADVLWTPSNYMANWIRHAGFNLPPRIYRQQYVIPSCPLFDPVAEGAEIAESQAQTTGPVRPSELVFFGRLEERKGIRLFCTALDAVGMELARFGICVVFLGKAAFVGEEPAEVYLRRRGRDWPFRWRLLTNLGQQEAISYLRTHVCAAVIASPSDNSPCTIYETLRYGIPFVAADTGGISELIRQEDRSKVLFEYGLAGLVQILARILVEGLAPAQPAIPFAETRRQWIMAHNHRHELVTPTPDRTVEEHRFVVLIDGATAAEFVQRTLESCRKALGSRIARAIVLWRRSEARQNFADNVCVGIPLVHADLPDEVFACLTEAETVETGDLLLCIWAGVQLREDAMTILDRAFSDPDIDGLLPALLVQRDGRSTEVPVLGGGIAFGFYEGFCFSGGAVLQRSLMRKIQWRGATPRCLFLGLVDLAIIAGASVWPLPEPILVGHSMPDSRESGGVDSDRIRLFENVQGIERFNLQAIGYHAHRKLGSASTIRGALTTAERRWQFQLLRKPFQATRTYLDRLEAIAVNRRQDRLVGLVRIARCTLFVAGRSFVQFLGKRR
jgi:glycosyltransferase involved in cell wall biosynthesis